MKEKKEKKKMVIKLNIRYQPFKQKESNTFTHTHQAYYKQNWHAIQNE